MKTILAIFFGLALFTLPFMRDAAAQSSLESGLVAWWPLDEGVGSTLHDYSWHGNTGSLNGGSWSAGRIGGAIDLDGVDDFIDLGDFASIKTSAKTISFWIKPSDLNHDRRIISNIDLNERFSIMIYGGQLVMTSDSLPSNNGLSPLVANLGPAGVWTHYAVVFDGNGQVTGYKNGVAQSTSSTNTSQVSQIGFGARLTYIHNYGSTYKGSVDDLRIYDRALSTVEVNQLSVSTVTPAPIVPTVRTVKKDGSGDFSTLNACALAVRPGDTCLVYSGTYNEKLSPSISGSYQFPITFRSAPSQDVQVDGIDLDKVTGVWIEGMKFRSVSQYQIEWLFDGYYSAGMFANGDYWVLGPVIVQNISPSFNGLHNGWEVNPVPQTVQQVRDHPTQAFDFGQKGHSDQGPESQRSFDPQRVPPLPYSAQPGQSLVKAYSIDQDIDPTKVTGCKSQPTYTTCLKTAAVLTVVASIPANYGKSVFRPPYVGANKPFYSLNQLQLNRLPSLARVEGTPSIRSLFEKMRRMQFSYLASYTNEMAPLLNHPAYWPSVARNNNEAILRLMLNEPMEDRMDLLIAVVQGGIDRYHTSTLWENGFNLGESMWAGEKVSIAFAGAMLDSAEIMDHIDWQAHHYRIDLEDVCLEQKTRSGVPTYGLLERPLEEADYGNYWTQRLSGVLSNSFSFAVDPYGYTESAGLRSVGDGYQLDFTSGGSWKGAALVGALIPIIKQSWNNPNFFDYVDRWMNIGQWTQPDACAPFTGSCVGGSNPGARCSTQEELFVPDAYETSGNSACLGGGTCDYTPRGSCVGGSNPGAACSYSFASGAATGCSGGNCSYTYFGKTFGDFKTSDGKHHCILDPNLVAGSTESIFSCQPGKLCGRYPKRHGTFKGRSGSGQSASNFVDAMWAAYRNLNTNNNAPAAPTGLQFR